MTPGTIALLIIASSVAVWALFMANLTVRKQRKATLAVAAGGAAGGAEPARDPEPTLEPKHEATAKKAPPERPKHLTPEEFAVSRRQFLNRAITSSFLGFLGFFGMSSLSFLWPTLTGGFGTKIPAGNYDDILSKVGPEGGFKPVFVADGRFWLTYYEGTGDDPVYIANNAKELKIQALYRKCVHLGCSVPHCEKSLLFECPCHGSKYRLSGEYYGGPAPRGLDRFPVEVVGGKVLVDTAQIIEGPPRGTNTWDKFSEPVGPFCVPT